MINRSIQSSLLGAVSLVLAACGGTEMDAARPRPGTMASLALTNLEQRGFCGNQASCWSSCSSIAGPGNMPGHNCAASGADIKAGTAPLINTTFTYPDTAPDNTLNTGLIWMGTDANGGFANAYWFTQLGSGYSTTIANFTYSMDIYVGNADRTYRAVEWDGNWFFGAQHFDFGLQNERNAFNTWRYFNIATGSWVSTGVPSTNLSGGWHHLAANFTVSGSNSELVSFTVDGVLHSGNGAWVTPATGNPNNADKATMGLQGDELNTGMSVWYKNVSVSFN